MKNVLITSLPCFIVCLLTAGEGDSSEQLTGTDETPINTIEPVEQPPAHEEPIDTTQPIVDFISWESGEWTDINVYFKKSLNDDGVIRVWVNGNLLLERNGPNLLRGNEGYTKIGMYTEIL